MDMSRAAVFVTGGAGTLGLAIAARRKKEGWTGKFTVYSTDGHKHERMRRDFPDIVFVQGDIRDPVTLYNAMAGHDICIHAAACKIIPESEKNSIDTISVNIDGSRNVCDAALRARLKHVLGISTDKACHCVNAYGATKYLMEKTFQEYSRMETNTIFHLVRYGNVLESNGSVVEAWRNAVKRGEACKITEPSMTRFWISPSQAVDYCLKALNTPTGTILIPKMPALSIGKLLDYTVGGAVRTEITSIRPGEKMHEELLTAEEGWYTVHDKNYYLLFPTTTKRRNDHKPAYTSNIARELTRDELAELLKNV